jgi:hypothetical protein
MLFFRTLYQDTPIQNGKYCVVHSDKNPYFKIFAIKSNSAINSNALFNKNDSLSCYLKNKGKLSVKYRSMNIILCLKADSV